MLRQFVESERELRHSFDDRILLPQNHTLAKRMRLAEPHHSSNS